MKKGVTAPKTCCKRPNRWIWGRTWALLLMGMGIAFGAGCGKKGPPFLPETETGPRVERLTGSGVNGEIRLEGVVAGVRHRQEITGCKVLWAWYPLDQLPCEGCPVEMREREGAVALSPSGEGFTCIVPVAERSGVWFVEIRLVNRRGAVGPPSERVRIAGDG